MRARRRGSKVITARWIQSAVNADAGVDALVLKRKTKPKRHPRKPGAGGLMPPKAKGYQHVAKKGFEWDELQRVLRSNSAHGIARVVYETKILSDSGRDMRRRIHALGFSVMQFAARHGIGAASIYEWTHWPAGTLPVRVLRLVEYEEQLVGIADILESESMTLDEIRAKLGAMLDAAVERL